MGIWSEIKHALNSTLGTSEFKSLDKIVEEKVNTAITNRSVIRHIQRGYVDVSSNKGSSSVELTGFTDANKMVVILGGSTFVDYNKFDVTWTAVPYVRAMNRTSLVIGWENSYSGYSGTVGYQVVEFW